MLVQLDPVWVKVIGQSSWLQDEDGPFSAADARYDVTYFLVVCRILRAKMVSATSSEAV